ncbi:hypothetical protein [Parasphingorhabdus sp.]|uniref:hypothetical protein n=1 Tax=Parasphingorhabdus sp. TaxID=2709688 RepID=UPI003299A7B2
MPAPVCGWTCRTDSARAGGPAPVRPHRGTAGKPMTAPMAGRLACWQPPLRAAVLWRGPVCPWTRPACDRSRAGSDRFCRSGPRDWRRRKRISALPGAATGSAAAAPDKDRLGATLPAPWTNRLVRGGKIWPISAIGRGPETAWRASSRIF